MSNYIFEYLDENDFRKKERSVRKYNMLAYKKLTFNYYPELRKGTFLGKQVNANEKDKTVSYELQLPTDELFKKVKAMGDSGKTITDIDFRSVAEAIQGKPTVERIKLLGISVMTGDSTLPTATVKLDLDGEVKYRAETGVGPVDAALNAIQSLVNEIVKFVEKLIEKGVDKIQPF